MPNRRLLAPTLALVACCAWAAEPAPVAELQLADGKDLITHWERTPWAKVWADPASKALHAPFAEWQAGAAKKLGGTPTELLAAIANARMSVKPGTDPLKPAFNAGADFGAFAAKLFALAKNADPKTGPATVAGADEALTSTSATGVVSVLARFADSLAMALNADAVRPVARTAPLDADLLVQADLPRIFEMIAAASEDAELKQAMANAKSQILEHGPGTSTYHLDLVSEGFLERLEVDSTKVDGYQPVDRTVLARLPATTLMTAAFGADGAAYWKTQRKTLLQSWAKLVGTDPADHDATEAAIDAAIAKAGLDVKLADIVTGWVGTSLFALSPGMPFPSLTIAIPRSPANDKLLTVGLGMIGGSVPEEGASAPLALPNVPVAVTVVRDKGLWIISSDATAGDQWLSGKPNGWADTAAAKVALAKAPADAYLIGASDTPAVLRLIAGYAGMALGMAKDLPADQKQAILQGLNVLAANASTGYVVGGTQGPKQVVECRSITGAFPSLVFAGAGAGVASYFRTKQRMEAAAPRPAKVASGPAYVLRSQIFPAEIQFQAGTYIDQDGDGIGEYGLLSELAGRRTAGGKSLALVGGPLARSAAMEGYAYAVYLPAGDGRVADDGKKEDRAAVKANADAQEGAFVAYAWPVRTKDGEMYALLADGTVYQAPFAGTAPAWNAVFDGKSWSDPAAWETVETDAGDDAGDAQPMQQAPPAPVEALP